MFSKKYFHTAIFILFFALFNVPCLWAGDAGVLRKSSYDLPADRAPYERIRVELKGDVPETRIKTTGNYVLTDQNNRPLLHGSRVAVFVKPAPEGILFGDQLLRSNPITLESQGAGFGIEGHTYRHMIQIWSLPSNKLLVVNEIPLEDYLKGVLPAEMSAEWPLESLKAQAVVSRTFALFRMMESHSKKFDLTKDTLNQVYRGRSLEHGASTRAVRDTQGQILTYKGKIFPAYFHSTCGGHTSDMSKLWNMEPHPCMRGVKDDFCKTSRHSKWNAQISAADLEANLKKAGYSIFGIRSVQLADYDSAGRAYKVVVNDSKGRKEFRASDFRFLAGPNSIKSTLITNVEQRGGKFYFSGRGWGHGAGLCQYGARKLGEIGYTYRQILSFYYPGSDITQFSEPLQFSDKLQDVLQQI